MTLPPRVSPARIPRLTTYADAESWLLSITDFERLLGSPAVRYDTQSFDVQRFRKQLTQLGDPHLQYAVVHVAGTKGKGSTCAFIEAALRACGLKTGLYTSPHLHKFTERIQVNGCPISDGDFARLVEMMGSQLAQPAEQEQKPSSSAGFRTVFEILTAAAFQFFAEQQVQVAIVETGLGGRLDSTNVFDRPGAGPLINVITAIGLDHTAILGNDVQTIATEKAGILRGHGQTVIATQHDPETEKTVQEVVKKRLTAVTGPEPLCVTDLISISSTTDPGSVIYQHRRPDNTPKASLDCGGSAGAMAGVAGTAPSLADRLGTALSRGIQLRPALRGVHQAQNAANALLAIAALETAAGRGRGEVDGIISEKINAADVTRGLESAQWPGRFHQLRHDNCDFVIDGAHCALSAEALGRACAQQFGDRPVIIIAGFLGEKAGESILSGVLSQVPVQHAIATAPPTVRSATTEHIVAAMHQHLPRANVYSTPAMAEAIKTATKLAQESGAYVLIYGSLYLVGPALDALGSRN